MATRSGKITFGSPGPKTVVLPITVNELDFYAGSRDSIIESYPGFAFGHADAFKQFTHGTWTGAETVQGEAMKLRNGAGTVVLEFTVTGGWGTNMPTFNVLTADPNYPFELIGRS